MSQTQQLIKQQIEELILHTPNTRAANNQTWKCTVCNKKYKNKKDARLHIAAKHIEYKPFECTECNEKFTLKNLLTLHNKKHMKNFICQDCGKACMNMTRLRHHQVMHSNEHKYQCHICKSKYKRKGDLKEHMITIHSLHSFKCDYPNCGKIFASKKCFNRHRYHHSDKYQCETCQQRCSSAHELQIHKRIHTNQRAFPCQCCSKKFKTQYNLNVHKAQCHTNESIKTHSCNQCNSKFAMRCLLNQHIRMKHKN